MRLFGIIFLMVLHVNSALADSIVRPARSVRNDSVIKKDSSKRDTSRRVLRQVAVPPRSDSSTSVVAQSSMSMALDSLQRIKDSIAQSDSIKKRIQDSIDWAATRIIKRPVLPLPEIDKIKFRVIKDNRWLFLIGFVLLLLIGLNRVLNIKRYDKLLWGSLSGAPIKSNEAVYKELSIHQIIAIVVITLTFAIWIQLMLPFPFENAFDSSLAKYFFIVSVLIFVYGLKAFFYHLVLTILQVRETPNLLFSQFVMITYALAVAILPLLMVYHYTPFEEIKFYLYVACITIAAILFVIRLIRTTIAFSAIFPYSIFYLFIYLCTLEIIPWMLIFQGYRFLIN